MMFNLWKEENQSDKYGMETGEKAILSMKKMNIFCFNQCTCYAFYFSKIFRL